MYTTVGVAGLVNDRLTAMDAGNNESCTTGYRQDLAYEPERSKGAPVFRYWVERALSGLGARRNTVYNKGKALIGFRLRIGVVKIFAKGYTTWSRRKRQKIRLVYRSDRLDCLNGPGYAHLAEYVVRVSFPSSNVTAE